MKVYCNDCKYLKYYELCRFRVCLKDTPLQKDKPDYVDTLLKNKDNDCKDFKPTNIIERYLRKVIYGS